VVRPKATTVSVALLELGRFSIYTVILIAAVKSTLVLRNPPEGAMVVEVFARQWSWRFEYANGFKTDKLIVPVDTPVEVQIVSEDVVQSFFVPAFRIKQDAVPGLTTRAWFTANVAGSYDILCAEYCGLLH
jgi:cytochrome c oxidase subunit 2